jgi:two-component system, OmpR family, sensor kinase
MRLDFASLSVPKLGFASLQGRLLLRGAFLLLIVATLALALVLLKEEKRRSHQNYAQALEKSQSEIIARLRHPSGQLALLNPAWQSKRAASLSPMLLPYAALDFDDQNKAQQAVEIAGCLIHYPKQGDVCVAIGNNPYAGGFVYIVGNFLSGELVGRERGLLDLTTVYRARVTLSMRGETMRWIAPYEPIVSTDNNQVRGRLTGFIDNGDMLTKNARPVRDFRGWLWQGRQCVEAANDCLKPSFFSIRLPVESFRQDLFQRTKLVWPPQDLEQIRVRIEILGPDSEQPLFDSDTAGATLPFALHDLASSLHAGETLRIRKAGQEHDLIRLQGQADVVENASRWITRLIQHLPIDDQLEKSLNMPVALTETIHTTRGSYEVALTGDTKAIDRNLSAVVSRLSWYVAAMLGAIGLAWLLIEVSFLRRVAILTKRAAAVTYNVQDYQDTRVEQRITMLDLSDLRGSDELGILAGGLSDLLQRVKDDVQREHIRAQQERDMWHAVGHEIMSPLQSLMVLHPDAKDTSYRYIHRMQQAIRVLYGSASPTEALETANLQIDVIDLNEFLVKIAANAHFAELEQVTYQPVPEAVIVRADEFSLEDVVTHILNNAKRYRQAGTEITISLAVTENVAIVDIANQGSQIDPAMLERIFDYGVSDADNTDQGEHRGQGLFVVKTYMAKMGGTVIAVNHAAGVSFKLSLQRVLA